MALSWRNSVLADRHRALGSKLEDWNGMGTAWTYSKDVAQDHVAIRTKAGLMDVSGLKKLHLVGPHSSAILNYATTRDVTKIYPGKSAYACMLNEAGHFIEDCILYRTGPNAWMVVHGVAKTDERVLIEQGIEMKRPSRIFVRASFESKLRDNRVVNVRVGGNSVEIMRGEVLL